MSKLIIEDAGWSSIMTDDRLRRARKLLSLHEIRLIVQHARGSQPSEPTQRMAKILGAEFVSKARGETA